MLEEAWMDVVVGTSMGSEQQKRNENKLLTERSAWTGQPASMLRQTTNLVKKYKDEIRTAKKRGGRGK